MGPQNKLIQFLHFVYATIFPAQTYYENGVVLQVRPESVSQSLLIAAGILLTLALIGFLTFWNRRFAQLAVLWVAFSLFLMAVMGWGGRENGMVLYTSYFAWAYIPLIGFAVYLVSFKNWRQTGTIAVGAVSLFVAILTATAIAGISLQAQDWFFAL